MANEIKAGDIIRGYDFQPMEDRPDRYVEGVVFEVDDSFYHIWVTKDTAYEAGVREDVGIPKEVYFGEYEGRVTVVRSKDDRFEKYRTDRENSDTPCF